MNNDIDFKSTCVLSGSENISRDSAMCAMLQENMPNFPLYELSCLIFFLLPMILMIIFYVRMGCTIQRTSLDHSLEGSIHGEKRQAQSKKTIIQMLSTYDIIFLKLYYSRVNILIYDGSVFF